MPKCGFSDSHQFNGFNNNSVFFFFWQPFVFLECTLNIEKGLCTLEGLKIFGV